MVKERTTTFREKMTFEEALKRLEEITKKLEIGNISLDESVQLFEEGSRLKKHCEALLKEAQLKVEKIIESPDATGPNGSKIVSFQEM